MTIEAAVLPSEKVPSGEGAYPRRVFIRDLRLQASIGVHRHERHRLQPIVVSIDLWTRSGIAGEQLRFADVICYDQLAQRIENIAVQGHVDLIETLAERIAEACLADRRVQTVRVVVEKTQALANASAAGVEVMRQRASEMLGADLL